LIISYQRPQVDIWKWKIEFVIVLSLCSSLYEVSLDMKCSTLHVHDWYFVIAILNIHFGVCKVSRKSILSDDDDGAKSINVFWIFLRNNQTKILLEKWDDDKEVFQSQISITLMKIVKLASQNVFNFFRSQANLTLIR